MKVADEEQALEGVRDSRWPRMAAGLRDPLMAVGLRRSQKVAGLGEPRTLGLRWP